MRLLNQPLDSVLMSQTDSKRTLINKAKVLRSLKQYVGNVQQACRAVNISKSQFYEWIKKDEVFAKKVLDVHRGIHEFTLVRSIEKLQNMNFNELARLKNKSQKRVKKMSPNDFSSSATN